jgi:hypothetical protein
MAPTATTRSQLDRRRRHRGCNLVPDIAEILGLTRQRICQLLDEAEREQ